MRLFTVLFCVSAAQAHAQLRAEGRVEVVRTTETRAELGLGLSRPLGSYVRAGVSGAVDVAREGSGRSRGRVEAQVRFLLDPIAERRWGLSFAGGLGVRESAYLMAAADLEGPVMNRMRPAIQLALGGGVRLGFVLRGARSGRR